MLNKDNDKGLYNIIKESIDRDLTGISEKNPIFKSLLVKESSGYYSLVDVEVGSKSHSIKCIFNQSGLNEYLATQPSFENFESFNNCEIILKKYRFDYLIVEVNEESLDYRVVIHIEDFEIIPSNKKDLVDTIPMNINSEKVIAVRVERVATIYLKKIFDEALAVEKPFIFDAKSFISKEFPKEGLLVKKHASHSLFSAIKKVKKVENNNFLIKSETSIEDPRQFLTDFDSVEMKKENEVINRIKKFDYKGVFSQNPTQVDRKKGEEFKVSKSDMASTGNISSEEKDVLFCPSNLNLNIEATQENIQNFLLRKVKRHRPLKNAEKIPQKIQELVKAYGDVCANISHDTLKKYQFYQRFYNL